MTATLRVRYAPSPTGHLHIGGARTALFNYLLARKLGGQFIIRFEDTDQSRHVEHAEEKQLAGLKWLGLNWDESTDIGGPNGPYRQTERLHLYRPVIEQLLASGDAYECFCSEEELERVREEQQARGETPRYAGTCRHLSEEQKAAHRASGRTPSIRFRVPEDETITFEDSVRGTVSFHTSEIGDFIIVRPDGIPTYNFAVVMDDHQMAITQVIRGEEHLTNTPRQLLIYRALGWEAPQFAHISLILNQDRKKMSKRDESIIQFIEQYRDLGYLPEAVVNFIALLGWSPVGEQELFTLAEITEQFGLDRIAKSPAVFDVEKMKWMNNQYIKQADLARLTELAIPHLQRAGRIPAELDEQTTAWVHALVGLYQEPMRAVSEIVELSADFFRDQVTDVEAEAQIVLQEEQVPAVLAAFAAQCEQLMEWDVTAIQASIKSVQKETGAKGKALFMPIRAALTGQTHGRDLNQTIWLLGRERVLARLRASRD
jgi:nondiscriminating glutamyl-tRNA synthetase